MIKAKLRKGAYQIISLIGEPRICKPALSSRQHHRSCLGEEDWNGKREQLQIGMRKLGSDNMFIILIEVMVLQVYVYVKTELYALNV